MCVVSLCVFLKHLYLFVVCKGKQGHRGRKWKRLPQREEISLCGLCSQTMVLCLPVFLLRSNNQVNIHCGETLQASIMKAPKDISCQWLCGVESHQGNNMSPEGQKAGAECNRGAVLSAQSTEAVGLM